MPAGKFAFFPVTLLVGLGIMSLCEGKDLACNQFVMWCQEGAGGLVRSLGRCPGDARWYGRGILFCIRRLSTGHANPKDEPYQRSRAPP